MATWSNADSLSSWKKLQSLKGMVSVADELSGSGAADRIAKYSIPMGGALTYNFAAKQVNEEVLSELDKNGGNLEMELGDLFFACVNAARLSGVDPESALQKATEKFISRFSSMENEILRDGKRFQDLTLSEMDVYWESSKKHPQT